MQGVIKHTPVTDNALQVYTLKTNDGVFLNETITWGQKQLLEILLNRGVTPAMLGMEEEEFVKTYGTNKISKVHVMAHTRFGKSLIIGAGLAIRASLKKEKWANIAPTKDQAQIIMDYMTTISTNDPIISSTLVTSKHVIETERLTQRRSRDHLTFKGGGEITTHNSTSTMGFGSKNIILDEAGLVTDEEESKIYRMLGDNATDFFYMKIGNPWYNNHFKHSADDETYFHINFTYEDGIEMGRLTEEFLTEARKKPNFGVLYENKFPDVDGEDKYGWRPLISQRDLDNAQVEAGEGFGDILLGGDPAGGGTNNAVIVKRQDKYAKILFSEPGIMPLAFADEMARRARDLEASRMIYDEQGVGKGTKERLEGNKETKRLSVAVNSAKPINEKDAPGEDVKSFFNGRAYIFWKVKTWIEAGGRLEKDERWKNLLKVKYRIHNGKVQIISKKELKEKYGIDDLGESDALSYTFFPGKPNYYHQPEWTGDQSVDVGGVAPLYPDIGI